MKAGQKIMKLLKRHAIFCKQSCIVGVVAPWQAVHDSSHTELPIGDPMGKFYAWEPTNWERPSQQAFKCLGSRYGQELLVLVLQVELIIWMYPISF